MEKKKNINIKMKENECIFNKVSSEITSANFIRNEQKMTRFIHFI